MLHEPKDRVFAGLFGLACMLSSAIFFLSHPRPWALRGDNKVVLFPMSAEAFRQWLDGVLPVWTGGQWLGFPLLSDAAASTLYPLHAVAFLATPAPHLRAFDLSTAIHIGVLAAGSVRLLLALGAGRAFAACGTLVLLLSPHVYGWTHFQPSFCALAWWPWLLLAAHRLCDVRVPALPSALLGSLALGLQVLAGYPEFALYSASLAGAWLVTGGPSSELGVRVLRLAALGGLAGLIAAPQALPTALEVGDTFRAQRGELDALLTLYLPDRWAVIHPRPAVGFPLVSAFLGVGTLAAAGAGVWLRVRQRGVLVATALIGALLAMGNHTPLYGWLTALPLFEMFRGPHKLFLLTQFALTILAALGLRALQRQPFVGARAVAVGIALVALGEHLVYAAQDVPELPKARRARALELPADLEPIRRTAEWIRENRQAGEAPPRVWLIGAGPVLSGSLGMVYGIDAVHGGYPALLSDRHRRLERLRPRPVDMDRLGVQLLLALRGCTGASRGELVLEWRQGDACLWRNPASPRRIELLDDFERASSEAEMLAIGERRPGGPVPVLEPPTGVSPAPSDPSDGVEILAWRPGRVRVAVTTERDRLLLVRESWKRGWRAQVDGEPVPVVRAGGWFFAVPVPRGNHEVVLRFWPPGLTPGLVLATGWIGLAVFAVRPGRERSGSARSEAP